MRIYFCQNVSKRNRRLTQCEPGKMETTTDRLVRSLPLKYCRIRYRRTNKNNKSRTTLVPF